MIARAKSAAQYREARQGLRRAAAGGVSSAATGNRMRRRHGGAESSPGARSLAGERGAAAAGGLGVRVDEAEPGACEPVAEIQRRSVQEERALAVHDDADAFLFVDLVSLRGVLLEVQIVRHAGAAAADHRDPQAVAEKPFLLHDLLDLLRRLVRDVNHRPSVCASNPFIVPIPALRPAPRRTKAKWTAAGAPPP